jgi:hypothetical protein
MFLFAGREGGNGEVPCAEDMAWTLRIPVDELQADLDELERIGIIRQDDGTDPFVVHFEERQAPVTDAERKRQERARRRHEQYTGMSQPRPAHRHEPVTTRDTELDIELDIELDNNATSPSPESPTPAEVVFLEQIGPFEDDHDRQDILNTEIEVGSANVIAAIKWARRKHVDGNSLIQSICTAATKWSTGPPSPLPDPEHVPKQDPIVIPRALLDTIPGVD